MHRTRGNEARHTCSTQLYGAWGGRRLPWVPQVWLQFKAEETELRLAAGQAQRALPPKACPREGCMWAPVTVTDCWPS